MPRAQYVTQEEFYEAIAALHERLDDMATGEQVDVDALTAEVEAQGQTIAQVALDAAGASTQLQTQMDALEALVDSGTPPAPSDLTALKSAVAANTAALAPLHDAVTKIGGTLPTPDPAPVVIPPGVGGSVPSSGGSVPATGGSVPAGGTAPPSGSAGIPPAGQNPAATPQASAGNVPPLNEPPVAP